MSRFLDAFFSSEPVTSASLSSLPTLEALTSEYILTLLALTHHNISQTARILNVSRTTLYNRIRRQTG